MTVQDICSSFDIGGKYVKCKELFTGNINSTYHIEYFRDGEQKDYILQRINTFVFANPEALMNNILCVTDYVRENVKKKGLSTKRFVLRAFLSKDGGKPFFVDEKGNYWRIYRYIKNSVTYDSTDDLKIIENIGLAFGRFQNCLDGFNTDKLHITLPNFHNTLVRYQALKNAIEKDSFGRVEKVKDLIADLMSFEERACMLQTYLRQGKIPMRVTHNDTKCNNVAFDKDTGEPLAVLDLDTVMPGAIAFDFGDAIRFIANTTIEDDADIEKVGLDLEKYHAFAKGFLGEIGENLLDFEKKTLNLGVFAMTVELAVRFLTDYIEGDVYFKTNYPGHNYDRARNQIALAKDILVKKKEIEEILVKYI